MSSSRPVAVMSFDADNDTTILVVVCLSPIDAYASRDGKHVCHLREGKLVLVKGATVSDRESELIVRVYQSLRVALGAIHVRTI